MTWLSAWASADKVFDRHTADSGRGVVAVRLPEQVSPVPVLQKSFVRWLTRDDSPLLVWVYEYGVWPSSEDWNLYERWRRGVGEPGNLEEMPGHLFKAHEAADATSLLMMACLFGWGVRAISREARRGLQVDHDGLAIIVAEPADVVASAPELITSQ